MNLRLIRMGLSTLFGWKKQGYFIPYRYADMVPDVKESAVYPELLKKFDERKAVFEDFLKTASDYYTIFERLSNTTPPTPRFEQDWFPRLDGVAAYTAVRTFKPETIIEVGSGHSTRFMMQAVKDEELQTQITAIDPAPRADISKLPITVHNRIVQEMDLSVFSVLKENDILFIDSSHIALPGSDVDFLFLNVLPALKKGVIVHIHDIFLPHHYPKAWEWRGYNEQQAVAPLLDGGYEIMFSSAYAARYLKEEITQNKLGKIPLNAGAFETSLWLRKRI